MRRGGCSPKRPDTPGIGNGATVQRPHRRTDPMSATATAQQQQQTPNNLIIAILSALLFFPLGALALVNAVKVNRLTAEGKVDEAQAASAGAKKYAYIAIITGVVLAVLAYTAKVATGN